MDHQLKKFHFQELDWVFCFPERGNKGKYLDYYVQFTDRKKQQLKVQSVRLGEILSMSEFEDHFPHTVGFFRNSSDDGINFKPDYMEIRFIGSIEDFWLFLNALNI